MPYLGYLGMTLYYMINVVCGDEADRHGWETWIGVANLLQILVVLRIEYT